MSFSAGSVVPILRIFSVEKAREFYSRRFRIAYPNEHWPAGRPARISALHSRLLAKNAVHGVSYGLEYPLYFAPAGTKAEEVPTLRRSGAFGAVAAECRAARSVGAIMDACAAPRPHAPGTWITSEMRSAYLRVHRLGQAHSFEAWRDGKLAGGLYGVRLGGVFFRPGRCCRRPRRELHYGSRRRTDRYHPRLRGVQAPQLSDE